MRLTCVVCNMLDIGTVVTESGLQMTRKHVECDACMCVQHEMINSIRLSDEYMNKGKGEAGPMLGFAS